ncbi:MAG: hypothetical protein ACREIP_18225 [Alphaproteobacteria bacterium]
MSTCDEVYQKPASSFSERVVTTVVNQVGQLSRSVTSARDTLVRIRRRRATEMALDTLPENIRCDIGWPDLYERQIGACNEAKRRAH